VIGRGELQRRDACRPYSNPSERSRRSDVTQDKKRELRQLKREIKRAGGKRRRRLLKQGLAEHPDDAHNDSPGFGRF
jgi:hypothetical protein